MEGLAGAVAVGEGGAQALVLADEPATSCYLPEHRAFLRRLAADSEAGLKAAATAVLADPATVSPVRRPGACLIHQGGARDTVS